MAATAEQLVVLQEAVAHFLPSHADVTFTPTSGGVNNVVFYVKNRDDVLVGVLRVYNNGNDDAKVAYEHAVLGQLRLHADALPFALPDALPALTSPTTTTYVKLSTGACAALFKPIPGTLPGNSCVRAIGRASGELNAALARVNLAAIPSTSPNFPYHDLYKVHHAIHRDAFFATMRSAALDPWRPFADKVCAWVEEIEGKIDAWRTSSTLPTQLIHGDLHYDNVLVEGERITGLLDFEFSAMDWRAMELAICLSKYAGEAGPMAYLQPFIEGYAEHAVRLTADEVAAVPSLIILRILSNVVYFVGRALAKEDELSTLTKRIETYCKRVDWLTANADALVAIMRERFLTS